MRRGVRGDSFIIQGPPGTGKSQTIANLIAALVAGGKRVLFVCEKRAALDVVAHRLDQVGLGELVATIHDSQLDRKAFIADLRETYERWTADDVDERIDEREHRLARVNALLVPLERVFTELHDARGGRRSLAELIERLVFLHARGVVSVAVPAAASLDAGRWLAARPLLDRVAEGLAASGRPGALGDAPVLRLAPDRLSGGDPVVAARAAGVALLAAVEGVEAAFGPAVDPAAVTVASLPTLADRAPMLASLARHSAAAVLDRTSGAHLDLRAAAAELDRSAAEVATAAAVLERWREPLAADDARAALEVARAKESSALRFLDGRWRTVKRLVRAGYRFDLHQVPPSVAQVLTELVAWHDANDALRGRQAALAARYGTDDVRSLLAAADELAGDPVVAALAGAARPVDSGPPDSGPPDSGQLDSGQLGAALAALAEQVDGLIVDRSASVADLRAIAVELTRASVADERALVAWADLDRSDLDRDDLGRAGVDRDVLVAALGGHRLDEVERAVLEAALGQAGASGALGAMTGAQLDRHDRPVARRLPRAAGGERRAVRGAARERFREHVAFAEASMAGRPDEDKEAKRSLLRRAQAARARVHQEDAVPVDPRARRRRHGLVVRDLKPVWLMSPLSVSDTLPLDDTLFDVVVFDEASQIPVEDAVPTLFRARQAIVVGDRMQLPPTRFFAADCR